MESPEEQRSAPARLTIHKKHPGHTRDKLWSWGKSTSYRNSELGPCPSQACTEAALGTRKQGRVSQLPWVTAGAEGGPGPSWVPKQVGVAGSLHLLGCWTVELQLQTCGQEQGASWATAESQGALHDSTFLIYLPSGWRLHTHCRAEARPCHFLAVGTEANLTSLEKHVLD